ncbi:conserved hypothetical protein [methanotrophic bacterial endosymbiont of Bathymodiolus sp.]|nr:conserved hypothetical protein [methanotrophic bacterial endosymbiont of Bathymodiolus sp.]
MAVFPTPVGVFLKSAINRLIEGSLPHARGGVSDHVPLPRNVFKSSPRPWGCFYLRYAARHQ